MGRFKNIVDLQEDEAVAANGIELSFGNGRFITVTRTGASNRKYKAVMGEVFKPYQTTAGAVKMSDDDASDLLKLVYAKSVVMGWRGFVGDDDKEIKFTTGSCVELFTEAPEIFDIVQEEAGKFSNFARTEVEEAGKK